MLWILLIYVLSSLPNLHFRFKLPIGADKVVHAAIYFVLCWLVHRAFYNQRYFTSLARSSLLGAFIFSVVYGLLDEYHQSHVPGRLADVNDLLADAGGALLFVAIAWMMQRRNGDAGGPERG